MEIPFVDLKHQHLSIQSEIDQAIRECVDQASFVGGEIVRCFERDFAALHGMKHCVGVGNGTDALYIILKMIGIKAGDEVITAANTWISASETISQTGATPVFVDVDDYFTMDAEKIKSKITNRTKAIIPVHLYGQPVNISALLKICTEYGLHMVEDCAQAHFSQYEGRYTGTFGIASAFSFYPSKNLGAFGDGGAILTNDDSLAQKFRMYANHGALQKNQHEMEGINSRLDTLQANILRTKLRHILRWNEARIQNAKLYNQYLQGIEEIEAPGVRPKCTHTFHLYVIKADRRNELQAYLATQGIETSLHYPVMLPLLKCYAHRAYRVEDFPKAFFHQNLILSLPMFPGLAEESIKTVATAIQKFYND